MFYNFNSEEEKQAHNERIFQEARKAHAKYIEWDGDVAVGYGTDETYDTHAIDVQNGDGFYDDNGNYQSFNKYEYD